MNLYLSIRFLHIASAIALIGGVFARQLVRTLARQTDDIRKFDILHQAAGIIEKWMVIPGNLAAIITGVIMGWMVGAPILGFIQGASRNWLLVSNILLLLGLAVVPLVFVPHGKIFEQLLKDALAKGQMTPDLRAHLDDKTIRRVHIAEMAGVILILILMVLKPL